MNLFPALEVAYCRDSRPATEAQRLAELIAFGPIVFQVARIMLKWGILELLRNSPDGLTADETARRCSCTAYAAKVLLESSLTLGLVTLDREAGRFHLAKTGWFLLTDPLTRVNLAFNHDVNYEGMFRLEESLREGRPVGLEHFGPWRTIYEGLSQLPPEAQESWLAFDHFYSDQSFREAADVVFGRPVRRLLDVGGNTGRWALHCVAHHPEVEVTVMDLPQQLDMMAAQTEGLPGADRIHGLPADVLAESTRFPAAPRFDAIWMSQFLDCFSPDQIVSILSRAAEAMAPDTYLYILETFWDRQKYETAAFCLTQISLYFSALANGNSKMYHSEDMADYAGRAGLEVVEIHDNLGHGHSLMVCRRKL